MENQSLTTCNLYIFTVKWFDNICLGEYSSKWFLTQVVLMQQYLFFASCFLFHFCRLVVLYIRKLNYLLPHTSFAVSKNCTLPDFRKLAQISLLQKSPESYERRYNINFKLHKIK